MPRYRLTIDIEDSACEWCGGDIIPEECDNPDCDCAEFLCRECGNPAQDQAGLMIDALTELMRSDILSACELVCYCGQVH